jgi:hypothetical protein
MEKTNPKAISKREEIKVKVKDLLTIGWSLKSVRPWASVKTKEAGKGERQ